MLMPAMRRLRSTGKIAEEITEDLEQPQETIE